MISPSSSFPLVNAALRPTERKVLATAAHPGGAKRPPGQAILSGGIAGGIEICITYPTEYIKTQMQLYENLGKMGPIACAKETVRTRGVLGLYKGLSSLLYFSIPKSAVRFFAYEQLRALMVDDKGKLSTSGTLLAGLGAGVAEAILVVTPMETIKVRLIHDQLSAAPKYKGFVHGVRSIASEFGMSGIYKGLLPTIIKQGSNQAIRFFVYGEVKKLLEERHPQKELNPLETALAGAIAGAASVFGNTPVDVVKTRMQGLSANKYKNSWDCVVQIAKHEGVKGFYKGTTARLGRVCADVAIVFTLYEQINKVLDKLWQKQ